MSELHAAFATWIADGATDELPRDVAVHAWGCAGCLALAAGVDALQRTDVGAADPPPIVPARRGLAPNAVRAGRLVAGVASLAFLAAAIVVGSGLLPRPPSGVAAEPATGTPAASASIAEGVLGGVPETPDATLAEAPTSTPTPTPAVILPTPATTPVLRGPAIVPTAAPAPPIGTPRPTPAATPRPPTPPPPTPVPTPTAVPPPPTRVPTPTPVPTPTLPLPSIPPP